MGARDPRAALHQEGREGEGAHRDAGVHRPRVDGYRSGSRSNEVSRSTSWRAATFPLPGRVPGSGVAAAVCREMTVSAAVRRPEEADRAYVNHGPYAVSAPGAARTGAIPRYSPVITGGTRFAQWGAWPVPLPRMRPVARPTASSTRWSETTTKRSRHRPLLRAAVTGCPRCGPEKLDTPRCEVDHEQGVERH